jgi:hypothetical protein
MRRTAPTSTTPATSPSSATPRRVRDAEVLVATLDGEAVGTVVVAAHGTPYAETSGPDELEVRISRWRRRRGARASPTG